MEKANQKLNIFPTVNFKGLIHSVLLLLAFLAYSQPVQAGFNIISDEETELYLAEMLQPLYKAANIPFSRNKIYIVDDNSLNAFVSDGNYLFIHSGLLLSTQTPDELRGVLAHEIGHIQGGHIIRQKLKQRELRNIGLASMAIAGALGAASGRGDVAAAVALGSQSSLFNNFLAHKVEEERSADEAAVHLLKKTGHSSHGLLNMMKRIQSENKMQGIDESLYIRTHPLSAERIAFLQQETAKSSQRPTSAQDEAFKKIQAKLYGFLKTPRQTYAKYPKSPQDEASQYAHAAAAFKELDFRRALNVTNALIAKHPNNPHYRELKGQILLEKGDVKSAHAEFVKASQLAPHSVLFQLNQAQTALELSPSKAQLQHLAQQLQKTLTQRQTSLAWLLLSRVYGELGNEPYAQYAAAEFNARNGDRQIAIRQAEDARFNSKDARLNLKIDDLLSVLKKG